MVSNGARSFGIGGEVFLLALGFSLIPDLTDGHGQDAPKSARRPKVEVETRRMLDDLNEDFLVLRDVESPHGTIQHVVLSRNSGIFLIETKPLRRNLDLDDTSAEREVRPAEPHVVDQCTIKTYWVRDRITEIVGEKPWITPLLVLPNAFVPQDLKIGSVRIVNAASLLPTLSENGGRRRKSTHIWDARTLIADSLLG